MIAQSALLGLTTQHVEILAEAPQHALLPDVTLAFRTLQFVANEQGIDLQLVSSFRPFTRQLQIWERKYKGEAPLYSAAGELLDYTKLSEWEKLEAILTWSALPGASRHHWGTDMDLFDRLSVQECGTEFQLIESEYTDDGPCADLAAFLQKHAGEHGFFLPYNSYNGGVAREPWHISYEPVASDMLNSFMPSSLYTLIKDTNISGKSLILDKFDVIIERFVFNNQRNA